METNDLKRYAQEGLNVLLTGKHGVGKTAIIKDVFGEVFGEHDVNYKYYSASTMDPFVDFIGIPKNYVRDDGKEVFGIIPPDNFTGDEQIYALFFDEINRAEEKTLNALMELLQFRSINGRKFPNLQCIWAAENPHDDDENEYMVEELDPAQRDRFDIQITIPNKINKAYFRNKFGKDITSIAADWWDDVNKEVSPRRLDKILEGYQKGFKLAHYVNSDKVPVSALEKQLKIIDQKDSVKEILHSGNEEAVKDFMTTDNVATYKDLFNRFPEVIGDSYKYLDSETLSSVLLKNLSKGEKKKEIQDFIYERRKEERGNQTANLGGGYQRAAESLENYESWTRSYYYWQVLDQFYYRVFKPYSSEMESMINSGFSSYFSYMIIGNEQAIGQLNTTDFRIWFNNPHKQHAEKVVAAFMSTVYYCFVNHPEVLNDEMIFLYKKMTSNYNCREAVAGNYIRETGNLKPMKNREQTLKEVWKRYNRNQGAGATMKAHDNVFKSIK